jgi:ATP-binding cassette, subfamily B, bacterial MsbA
MVRRLKSSVKRSLKSVFRKSIYHFGRDAQDGVKITARLLLARRSLLALLCLSVLVGAILEGGTMGLLGLAVSTLVGETNLTKELINGRFGAGVDQFIASTSASGLFLLMVGLAVVAQILKSIVLYISQAIEVYITFGVKRDIQRQSVTQLMNFSYGQVSQYSAGEVANVIDQADVVTEGVNGVANIVRATLMLLAYAVVMAVMSVKMALATIVIAAFLWYSLNWVVKILRRLGAESVDARMALWRWTIEFLNAPRLLRIFDATNFARDAINMARDEEIYPSRKANIIQAGIKPAIEAITVAGAGLFLIVGYALAGNGAQSVVPQLFVYVLIFYRLKPQLTAINDFRIKLAWITRRLEFVGSFLRVSDKEYTRSGGEQFFKLSKEIRFDRVSFRYPNAKDLALEHVSFSIPAGKTVALVGRSGAGKSTIADLVMGLYSSTNGEILVDGLSLSNIDLHTWRQAIGMVDQDVWLMNTSVLENIRFGRKDASNESVERAAQLAHADEFIRELEFSYDTNIGEKGYKLSGGQKQRIALARALLDNPELLILDEATSALDTVSEQYIQEALSNIRSTTTMIVIAHRLSTIASADKIIVLEDGRVVEQGTHQELIDNGNQFSRMWNLQVEF